MACFLFDFVWLDCLLSQTFFGYRLPFLEVANSSKNSTKSARRRKYSTTSVLSNSLSAESSESISSTENSDCVNESNNIEKCESREKLDSVKSADKSESRNNSNNLEDIESDEQSETSVGEDISDETKDVSDETIEKLSTDDEASGVK